MKNYFCRSFAVLFLLFFSTANLIAQSGEKFHGWKKASTEHFDFIFEESARETVDAYAQIADEAWNKIAEIYSIPKDKLRIYVTDRTNTVNAFTYFAPTEIVMFTTPVASNDFGFRTDWKKLFFTHELIHGANVTFEDKSYILSKIIGPIAKNFDYAAVPGWAFEGLTTVLETELTEGGRGRSPYFELNFKAPALENTLISYNEIGLEREPPAGQSYVMGYLIMRSIADRWGIEALADIERNRSMSVSWEESVKLVTGCSPDEIYRDVKIALTKKYNMERTIPEGIIVSPRNLNTNYYIPAVIYDDGSIIALRTMAGRQAAVVKLNPALRSGSQYRELTNPEKDLNTVFNETILFEGSFPEKMSVTADVLGNVYAVMQNGVYHKMPGSTVENAVYRWSQESGLVRLTKGASYFQPAVSKDGSKLVALKQIGLDFAIVEINTSTGAETVLLNEKGFSFVQPSLSADGNKLAFMKLDGKRAAVCVMDLETADYKVIYNEEGDITDPSYPHWNGDSLLFTDNKRGRLECFEFSGDFIKPVVSDPAGILWAEKNEKGIYYSTFSGTGYVLKMKPLEEWGNVPDFDGPSMPGQIMTFGKLENDYPEFIPYEKKWNEEMQVAAVPESAGEPVAVKGKVVKHRSEEKLSKLENLPVPETELSKTKAFIPWPTPYAYLPVFDFLQDDSRTYFGFGAGIMGLTPKLQMATGIALADFIYFPVMNNFSFDIDYLAPAGTGTLYFMADRILLNKTVSGVRTISESNLLHLGYGMPVYAVTDGRSSTDFSIMAAGIFNAETTDTKAFHAFSKSDYRFELTALAGLNFLWAENVFYNQRKIAANAYFLGLYDFNQKKMFAGVEGDFTYANISRTGTFGYDFGLVARYADFPGTGVVPGSSLLFKGEIQDCSYPFRTVFDAGASLNNLFGTILSQRVYQECMLSTGGYSFDLQLATGIEIGIMMDEVKIAAGYCFETAFKDDIFKNGKFYFTFESSLLKF